MCQQPRALGRVTLRHCVTLMHSGTQHLISATHALCVRRHSHLQFWAWCPHLTPLKENDVLRGGDRAGCLGDGHGFG